MKLLSSIVNGSCEGFCFIKSCEVKVNRNKNEYLDMILADAEGEVNAKLWDYSKERFGTFTPEVVPFQVKTTSRSKSTSHFVFK